MIKEVFICLALLNMKGVINQHNICNNVSTLNTVSKEYNINSEVYVSMLWVESNFTTSIDSYTGKACGISQVVPKWSRPRVTCEKLNSDPEEAIRQGARIFHLFKKYGKGSLDISLCGYNQGYRCKNEVEVKNKNDYDPKKTGMFYANKVKKFRKRLRRQITREKKRVEKLKVSLTRVLKSFNII